MPLEIMAAIIREITMVLPTIIILEIPLQTQIKTPIISFQRIISQQTQIGASSAIIPIKLGIQTMETI